MQKKDTTARKTSATRNAKTIRQRAQAIIDNKRRYDSDTREAIFNAMVKNHADLAECVKRAEHGETILDLADEQSKLEIAAQFIIDLYEVEKIPDFICDAVTDALNKASISQNIDIWQSDKDGDMELSRRGLADLFTHARMLSVAPVPNSTAALALGLADILNNPHTPVHLFNGIADVVSSMGSAIDYHTPEMINRALVAYTEREEKQAKGAQR